jgi:hypothetical protein
MIYLTGITASIATANASPPVVPGWLSDVLALPNPVSGALVTPDVTSGMNFTILSPQTCTGIRASWLSANGGPLSVTLTLWQTLPIIQKIAEETVTVTSGIVQTTGAFGTHNLAVGDYAVSTYNGTGGSGYSNGYVPRTFSLPVAYPNYTVFWSYSYSNGYNANTNASNSVCAYVEPLF